MQNGRLFRSLESCRSVFIGFINKIIPLFKYGIGKLVRSERLSMGGKSDPNIFKFILENSNLIGVIEGTSVGSFGEID